MLLAHSKDDNGKGLQTYESHVRGVHALCRDSLDRILPHTSPKIKRVFESSVLLASIYHDLGKLDSQAQEVLSVGSGRMVNHVDAGVSYLLSQYELHKNQIYLIAAILLRGHHVGLGDMKDAIFSKRVRINKVFSINSKIRDCSSCDKYDLGCYIVKDYVDSNIDEYIDKHKKVIDIPDPILVKDELGCRIMLSTPIIMKMALSILVDADHEDTSVNYGGYHHDKLSKLNPIERLNNLDSHIGGLQDKVLTGEVDVSKSRFDMRNTFYDLCANGIGISKYELINGTVGIGKTLAIMRRSLMIAEKYGLETIIGVLPYTSLIDQSVIEYRKALFDSEEEGLWNVASLHSVTNNSNSFQKSYFKAFNAPISVTTSVSFFDVFGCDSRTSGLKNLNKFAGAMVFFDEYDAMSDASNWPVMLMMIEGLSDFFGARFIFSSGSPVDYWDIEAFSAISRWDSHVYNVIPKEFYSEMIEAENNRVNIIHSDKLWNEEDLLRDINKRDLSTFVVFETRYKAAEFVNYLKKNTNREVYLRFSAASPLDRQKSYEKMKKRLLEGIKIILVATQGSETGLDLSFECGYKELTNYSSTLQMGGRISRGSEFKDAFLIVFKFNSEKFKSINPSFIGKKQICESVIKSFKKNNVATLYSPEYSHEIASMEIASELSKKSVLDKVKALGLAWSNMDFRLIEEEFHLIKSPTVTVLISEEIRELIENENLMVEAENTCKNEGVPSCGVRYVKSSDIQLNSINLYASKFTSSLLNTHLVKIDRLSKQSNNVGGDTLSGYNGFDLGTIYFWNGEYDPETYGVMVDSIWGILPMQPKIV